MKLTIEELSVDGDTFQTILNFMQRKEYQDNEKQEEYNIPLNSDAVFSLESATGGVSKQTTPNGTYLLTIKSKNLSPSSADDRTHLKCSFQGFHKILCKQYFVRKARD